jgi:hypothetical protein
MDKKESNVVVIYATAIRLLKTDKKMAVEFIKANRDIIKFTDSQLKDLELETGSNDSSGP